MLALSTCWHSHRHTDGRRLAAEARELGFEWIEISHGTHAPLLLGLLEAVAAGEIRVSSLHNFCPAPVEVMMDAPDVYEFTSAKPWERQRALSLTRKTLEMAARFGADRVVLHLGSVPMPAFTGRLEALVQAGRLYAREFCELKLRLVARRAQAAAACLDAVKAALDALLPDCERFGVKLGLETRSHFEQIPTAPEMRLLLEHYRDCPWIGAWHDFGHVQRQANLALLDHAAYLAEIAPRLIGCHVHDVQWPARDHRAPFLAGGVDLAGLLAQVPATVPLIWELSPGNRPEQVREALARWRQRLPERV